MIGEKAADLIKAASQVPTDGSIQEDFVYSAQRVRCQT